GSSDVCSSDLLRRSLLTNTWQGMRFRAAFFEQVPRKLLLELASQGCLCIVTQVLDQLARIGRQVAQPPDADGELAHCPGIGERDDRDRHGARDAMRGGLRHDTDSDVALD